MLLAISLWSCAGSQPAPAEPIAAPAPPPPDPLPAWNKTAAKTQIIEFVERVTDPDSPAFVEEPKRVATFDNDGRDSVRDPGRPTVPATTA